MARPSKVYRFDRELARRILELTQARADGITTLEMTAIEEFGEHPYQAIVANVLHLWDDACLHLQSSVIETGPLEGSTNYHLLALTGIGRDRLEQLQESG